MINTAPAQEGNPIYRTKIPGSESGVRFKRWQVVTVEPVKNGSAPVKKFFSLPSWGTTNRAHFKEDCPLAYIPV